MWQILQEEGAELICYLGSPTWETSSLSLLNQVQAQSWDGVLCVPQNVDIVGQLNLLRNWRPLPLIFYGKCFDELEFSLQKSLTTTKFLSAAGNGRLQKVIRSKKRGFLIKKILFLYLLLFMSYKK